MLGALQGFSTITAVIAVGWVLAHRGILGLEARQILADLAFFVASPALLLVVLAKAPVGEVLSSGVVVAAASAATVMAVAAAVARWRWRVGVGETVMAALCAGYVNSGNLGLPIALYVLGNVAYAAPVLLLQLLVLTPVSMTILDSQLPGARAGLAARIAGLFRNPITLGALAGLVLSVTHVQLPPVLLDPITLIGNLAVPCMLVACGSGNDRGRRSTESRSWPCSSSSVNRSPRPGSALLSGYAATPCSSSSSWRRFRRRRTSSPTRCGTSGRSTSLGTPSS